MSEPKGTEGFYLDEQGNPQDEEIHGDCEPDNPTAYNEAMWADGLARGLSREWLEHLYGPRPN